MQIDSKDYLVQIESDISGIIIQYPGCFAAKTPSYSLRVTLQLAIHTLAG